MHPLVLLPLATVILVILYLLWSFISTKKSQEPGNDSGIGGPNDPMA